MAAPDYDQSIQDAIKVMNDYESSQNKESEMDDKFNIDDLIEGGLWFTRDGEDKSTGQKKKMYYKIVDENGKHVSKLIEPTGALIRQDCFKAIGDNDECLELVERMKNIVAKQGDFNGNINLLTETLLRTLSDYDNFKAILKDIHPYFILLILKSFGFAKNEFNNQITPVSHWLSKTFPKYLAKNGVPNPQGIINTIKTGNLINFLTLMVNYINANPGIFKSDSVYDKDTYEQRVRKAVGEPEDYPSTTADKYKDRVYNVRFRSYAEALQYIKNAINVHRRRFNVNPMRFFRFKSFFPSLGGLNANNGFMFGGSNGGNPSVQVGGVWYQYQTQQFNNMNNVNCGTKFSQMMFNRLKSKLNTSNRKLHDNDEKNFKDMLQNLKTLEDKMYKYLSTMGDYVDGNRQYSNPQETVRYGEMQRFVDGLRHRGLRYMDQETKIIDALWRIANALDGKSGNFNNIKETPIPL